MHNDWRSKRNYRARTEVIQERTAKDGQDLSLLAGPNPREFRKTEVSRKAGQ